MDTETSVSIKYLKEIVRDSKKQSAAAEVELVEDRGQDVADKS